MSIYLLLLLLFILIKEDYNRITAEYLYGLTLKSTIPRLSTKCLIHHACGRCSDYSLVFILHL
jgi:hypothetical protein